MSRAIRSQASSEGVRRASLWFGFVGGGLAWTLHLIAAYAIAEFGCVGGLGARIYGNISVVAWMELMATAIAGSLAAAATAVAYRTERQLLRDVPGEGQAVGEKYTARLGFLSSGFFTFVILFESIPIFYYLREC